MEEKGNMWVAISILLAGLIIAGAVIFTNNGDDISGGQNALNNNNNQAPTFDSSSITPVSDADHIRGDINAPIVIVEYSDTECPFCKRLHETMNQLMTEYEGQIAWVYRHLPLSQLHPNAPEQSHATECVAEIAGEEAFWTYLDRIYATENGTRGFDMDLLPQYASDLGVDLNAFNECMDSGRYEDKIASQVNEAFDAGATGTPFNIVITKDGDYLPVEGAQPIEVWRQIIDSVLEVDNS